MSTKKPALIDLKKPIIDALNKNKFPEDPDAMTFLNHIIDWECNENLDQRRALGRKMFKKFKQRLGFGTNIDRWNTLWRIINEIRPVYKRFRERYTATKKSNQLSLFSSLSFSLYSDEKLSFLNH